MTSELNKLTLFCVFGEEFLQSRNILLCFKLSILSVFFVTDISTPITLFATDQARNEAGHSPPKIFKFMFVS